VQGVILMKGICAGEDYREVPRPESTKHMTNLQRTLLLLTSPQKAMADLGGRPTFWFPLVVTLLGALVVHLWYFQIVDLAWLADYAVGSNRRMAQLPEATRAAMAARMSKGRLLWFTVGAALLTPLIVRTLVATFFNLLGKLLNIRRTFQEWLAVIWWASLPLTLNFVAAALLLAFTRSRQISPPAMFVLSLNELFAQKNYNDRGFNILTTLTLLHPVAWWYTVRGAQALSGRSLQYSAAFTLIPIFLFYAAWALLPIA
jgi:hypothetical protein